MEDRVNVIKRNWFSSKHPKRRAVDSDTKQVENEESKYPTSGIKRWHSMKFLKRDGKGKAYTGK